MAGVKYSDSPSSILTAPHTTSDPPLAVTAHRENAELSSLDQLAGEPGVNQRTLRGRHTEPVTVTRILQRSVRTSIDMAAFGPAPIA